jgi:hypothetical protein
MPLELKEQTIEGIASFAAIGETSRVSTFNSTTSAQLSANNPARRLLCVFNEGGGTLFLRFGSEAATISDYTVRLAANNYFETDRYSGEVTGIFGAEGVARVTEVFL